MRKAKWLRFALTVALIPVFVVSATAPCSNPVTKVTNNYHYALDNAAACDWYWRSTVSPIYPIENYNFCWVLDDGLFIRTLAYPAIGGNPAPNTDLMSSQMPANRSLAFTGVANRKGDDTDKKKIAGGSNQNPSGNLIRYNTFPFTQTEMSFPKITRIQTDFLSDVIANDDEVLLVITINNDHIDGSDSIFQLMKSNYNLHLYHSSHVIQYDHENNHGVNPGTFPSGEDKYFEFAGHPGTMHNPTPSPPLVKLCEWKIINNFKGHEKNIYCVLKFSTPPSVSQSSFLNDTFTVVLSDTLGNYQIVPNSRFDFPYKVGASHDPNIIEVNHAVSTTCAAGEELEYTIHFQNIGSTDETIVEVNLDLDQSLNNSSLIVTEIGIGEQSDPLVNVNTPQALATYNSGTFEYTVGNSNTAYNGSRTGNVTPDVKFHFSGIRLEGINATDIQKSKGYIKFKVKTAAAFRTINNQAGIFFGLTNPEIVTNLAETRCMQDSTSMNCDSCRIHLKECRDQLKDGNTGTSNSPMNWLGWIIAGLELLIIIYLLTKRKN
ncbi:MAG: hypothetical protein ABIO46_02555 [Chitinophagales bacterium]